MDLCELTLILVNIFLVMLIIAIYVKLSNNIKNQGEVIRVIQSERFTPAQRWSWARKYRTAPNGLMPSDKQPKETLPYLPEMTNNRGDRAMSYMLPKGQRSQEGGRRARSLAGMPEDEVMKSGGEALGAVTVDTSRAIPDTSFLPVETQTGVIDNDTTDTTNFNVNPRANPSFVETASEGFFPRNNSSEHRKRRTRKTGSSM